MPRQTIAVPLDVSSLPAQCLLKFSHLSKQVGTGPVSVRLDSCGGRLHWKQCVRDTVWVDFFRCGLTAARI